MRFFSIALLVLLGTLPAYSAAQSFAGKPVRLVIGFPPGGGDDYHARVIAQKLTEIIGQVDMTFGTIPSALPHVRSGKVRALAVSGSRRATIAPDVPTVAEAGVAGFALDSWYAIFAPAATPKEMLSQFNAAAVKALASADVRERLIQVGSEPMSSTPEELTELLKKDLLRFGEIVRIAGAKAD